MKYVYDTLRSIWNSSALRGKFLATLALTVLFRFLASIPLIGVDVIRLRALLSGNQFLGVLNIFSGGTLENFSLMAVGVGPFITASIVLQVAGLFIPQIKEMQRESDATRAQLNQWTRFLTVPVAVLQSVSLLVLLRTQGLLTTNTPLTLVIMIASLVAGSAIVMWIGELITRYGIGNGMSWIIFVGIVSQLPLSFAQTWAVRDVVGTQQVLLLFVGLLGLMVSVVVMNDAVRRVPIQQARRQRGSNQYGGSMSHLPLKLLQFGVMPIIFALPILTLPTTIANLVVGWSRSPEWALSMARNIQIWLNPVSPIYNVLYFLFVFAFTFFSIFVYFQPKDFAEDLKKSGTFIPGVRPGKPTAQLLMRILLRISFLGGLYLGLVALAPNLAQNWTGVTTLTIGGTGLLIVVSVVLETMRTVQSQLVEDQYEKYL